MVLDVTDRVAEPATVDQECWSCGYSLAIHNPPGLDRNGGCPWDEVDAMRRWGLM